MGSPLPLHAPVAALGVGLFLMPLDGGWPDGNEDKKALVILTREMASASCWVPYSVLG